MPTAPAPLQFSCVELTVYILHVGEAGILYRRLALVSTGLRAFLTVFGARNQVFRASRCQPDLTFMEKVGENESKIATAPRTWG